MGVKSPQPSDTLFDSLRWVPFSLALHLCSSYVVTRWSKIYTKLTPNFKNRIRSLDNFRQAVESQKSWNSMGYICQKTTFLHQKHYLQIYLTLHSTDLLFRKWLEKYGKFFPEHSKLGFWWDPLIQTWKSMSLKSTEELSVMTMKNYAKFEEELTCYSKVDMRNCRLENSKVLKIFILMGSFWAKYKLFELKKVQRKCLS